MMRTLILACGLLAQAQLSATCGTSASFKEHIASPDGHLQVSVTGGAGAEELHYTLYRDGKVLLAPSVLGLRLADSSLAGGAVRLVSVRRTERDTFWKPLYGERAVVRDHYKEMRLQLQQARAPFRPFTVVIRAYDEGIAFRYILPAAGTLRRLRVAGELTTFRFAGHPEVWAASRAQAVYRRMAVSALREPAERPMVVRLDGSLYAAVGEAACVDFPRMKLFSSTADRAALAVELGSDAVARVPFSTPWRFVLVAAQPGALVTHNYLVENLNAPNQLGDARWIKPGKVIREVTLTTRGALACIDFAATHGLQYVEFDAGWYGRENSDTSDATRVAVDPARSRGPLDLHRAIRYGADRGIGIIVYVNRRALERQLDTLMPLYHTWGVKGIKFGFVDVGSQQANSWLLAAVRKAARYHLMVDIHDEYRPTGYSRTYPNLMTQEGVRGDEESPPNSQTVLTALTRMIAGAADHTVCYFGPRVGKMGSHVSQMAKTICLYSPWQFLYWYDRPPASGGKLSATTIRESAELAFFSRVPTVWDDSRVLEGAMGDYVTVLRRKGDSFYVGSINGDEAHRLDIALDFLAPGRRYRATVYTDDTDAPGPTGVAIDTLTVTRTARFHKLVRPGNGVVMVLKPE